MMTQDRRRMARCAGGLVLGLALSVWAAGAPPRRYTVSTDTVLDTKTALTWQRNVVATTYTWAGAATYCQNFNLGGMVWRLPTVKELQSLVDIRAVSPPAIDTVAFPNTPANYFWSSSPYAANTSFAWVVDFNGGDTTTNNVPPSYQVRCVR